MKAYSLESWRSELVFIGFRKDVSNFERLQYNGEIVRSDCRIQC